MLTPDEGYLDRRIAQEAGSLAARGWGVDIFSAVDPRLAYGDELPPAVHLLLTQRPPRPSSSRRGRLRRVRRWLAGRVPPVDRAIEAAQYRRRDIAGEISQATQPELLRLEPYELVVAHDVPVMPVAERLKTAWGARLISDLHEVFPEQDEHFTSGTARAYWRALEGAGLAASDGIICVNDAVADYVRTTHGPAAPVAVVHNAVPYVTPSPEGGAGIRSIYPIPDGARVMLFAGSLRPHTSLEVLIEGFGRADLGGWVLAILGAGSLQAELEGLVRRLGLGGRVYLGRRVDQRDLIRAASSADVGLLPYQAVGFNHLIATPNKLFEYIQARLPIATSRLPMVERIVNAHGNGAYLDFSNASRLGTDLAAFVGTTLGTISPAALEAAARQFSWENEEVPFLGLVDQVMDGFEATPRRGPAVTA